MEPLSLKFNDESLDFADCLVKIEHKKYNPTTSKYVNKKVSTQIPLAITLVLPTFMSIELRIRNLQQLKTDLDGAAGDGCIRVTRDSDDAPVSPAAQVILDTFCIAGFRSWRRSLVFRAACCKLTSTTGKCELRSILFHDMLSASQIVSCICTHVWLATAS